VAAAYSPELVGEDDALLVARNRRQTKRSKAMKRILTIAGVGLFAIALVSSTAIAQKAEDVTVQASRVVNTKTAGYTSSRVPITDVSLTYRVNLADLDLASSAGATQLEKRVNDAAQEACKELGRLYQNATPSDAECAKLARDKAMVDVRQVLAAARKTSTN
jgi:UrcA family protein